MISMEEWLYKEAQWSPPGFYIWAEEHKRARYNELLEALGVLPHHALETLGISYPEEEWPKPIATSVSRPINDNPVVSGSFPE